MRSSTLGAAPVAPLSHDAEVIGLVGFAHGTSHFLQLLLPPLFPWLTRHFSLSFTRVGALMTVLYVTSGAGQAAAGFFVDRAGALRVLCGGLALIGTAAFLVAAAPSYPFLLAAAALAGAGNAVFHPADFSLLNRHVSASRLAPAFSAHGLTGYFGWAAAPVTVAGVAAWLGWRAGAAAGGLLALATLAVVVVRARVLGDRAEAAGRRDAHPTRGGGGPLAFLGVPAIWLCFLFFVLSTLSASALQNFGPTVLQVTHGLSLRTATAALTLYMLGGAAGMTAGGLAGTRGEAHGRRIAVALGAAALVSLAVAVGGLPGWSVPPAVALVGACTGFAGPSRDLLVRGAALSRFGARSFGRIYGFVYSGFDVGGAIAPLLFAGLLDRGRFRQVLVGIAALQAAALLTALQIGRDAEPGGAVTTTAGGQGGRA